MHFPPNLLHPHFLFAFRKMPLDSTRLAFSFGFDMHLYELLFSSILKVVEVRTRTRVILHWGGILVFLFIFIYFIFYCFFS